jgi:hypothetical protein
MLALSRDQQETDGYAISCETMGRYWPASLSGASAFLRTGQDIAAKNCAEARSLGAYCLDSFVEAVMLPLPVGKAGSANILPERALGTSAPRRSS